MKKKPNQKHLKISDRILIETSLNEGALFKDIALVLSKDPTSISKEVRKHRVLKEGTSYGSKNSCKHIRDCKVRNGCDRNCNVLCKKKKNCQCFLRCRFFEQKTCIKLSHAPHVCNGCESKVGCRLDKYYYRAEIANNEYRDILSSSREGINMTKSQLHELDILISPRIKNGQPISHVCKDLEKELPVGERTIYNYVESGVLSIKNIDLRRKVKYKPRRKNATPKKDRTYRIGRTYRDFEKYMQENPDANVVEMDTVYGKSSESGPILLTMLFRRSNLMLIFLLENGKQEAVSAVFSFLKAILKNTDSKEGEDENQHFKNTFQVILTDNGNEFTHWTEYLSDEYGELLSEIFFCDPNAAYQKGRIEKNHEYIRYIIPKGKSFKELTNMKVMLIMNHINSVSRPSLNGHSPYEFGMKLLPKKLVEALGLELIPADKVILKPELLN